MKVSVSLPDDDVAFLDEFAQRHHISSRSAALHQAVRLLRASQLEAAYQEAWDEWRDEGEQEAWESTVSDGLT